jgi:hypothetical protein
MLRGTQKTVLTPGKNQKRYLAGALDDKTGKLTWVEWDRKDSDLFILQLWQLVRAHYPNAKCIYLQRQYEFGQVVDLLLAQLLHTAATLPVLSFGD